jgi:hypothetical protein
MRPETTDAEFRELVRRTGHTCPPWCHRCPLMPDREVMPMCYGSIHNPNPKNLDRCNCPRPERGKRGPADEDRIGRLEKKVAELERKLSALLEGEG